MNLISSALKLRSATRAKVEHFGTSSVRKQLGRQARDISFKVATVSGPIAFFFFLSRLEDAGWTFESTRAGQKLHREQDEIEVSRRDGVSWVRLDDARKPETALRRCPFSADVDVQPAKEVRSKKISVIPDDDTRSTRYNTPPSNQLVRPLDGGPSPPPRQKQADDSRGRTRLHVLGDDCRPEQHEGSTATILHAVDIQTLMRIGAVDRRAWSSTWSHLS